MFTSSVILRELKSSFLAFGFACVKHAHKNSTYHKICISVTASYVILHLAICSVREANNLTVSDEIFERGISYEGQQLRFLDVVPSSKLQYCGKFASTSIVFTPI